VIFRTFCKRNKHAIIDDWLLHLDNCIDSRRLRGISSAKVASREIVGWGKEGRGKVVNTL